MMPLTKMIAEKRRWRTYKDRKARLPANHRAAVEALERYLTYFGQLSDGSTLMSMLEDLADLFERSAADETPVRTIVGDDPVDFAETFLQNYSEGQWIGKERERLVLAIDRAVGDGS